MQVQAKSTKLTCSSAHVGGGRIKFMSANNNSDDYKYPNMLVESTVAKALKIKKKSKAKSKEDSKLDDELKILNFEHLEIRAESK